MAKIKNIIFDFGVVLVDLQREQFLKNFKEIGIKNVESLTGTALHKGIFADLELGKISKDDFLNEIVSISENEITKQDVEQAWLSMLSDIPAFKLEKLVELRKNYNIFLLSNTNELHWDVSVKDKFNYNGYSVEDYFDEIWLSYQIKMLKPTKEIFEYVISKSGIKAEETLFVDDAAANCVAAQELGITTYQPIPNEDWREQIDLLLSK